MDILKYKKEIEDLSEIYLVANTPRFLYNQFRSNSFVQTIAEKHTTDEIISNFLTINTNRISNFHQLTALYALYIALTFKLYDDVSRFYNNEGKVQFEWFNDISSIYLNSYTPSSSINLHINLGQVIKPTWKNLNYEDFSKKITIVNANYYDKV